MPYVFIILAVTLTTFANVVLVSLDRFKKEPFWLLALIFLWGAVPAVIISLVVEIMFGLPLGHILSPTTADLIWGSFLGPITKEAAKALALFAVFYLYRFEFDDVLDGIVFGVFVGAGFAWIEDIKYLFYTYAQNGFESMRTAFIFRVFVFGLNHAVFSAIIGCGFGIARVVRRWWLGVAAVIFFFGLGVSAHALQNTLVRINGEVYAVVAFLVQWGNVFGLLMIVVGVWIAQWNIITRELREEIKLGTITEREYGRTVVWHGRAEWGLRFLFDGDLKGFFLVRKMYNTLVKLAFLKYRYKRRPDEETLRTISEKRRRVGKIRAELTGGTA